MKLAKELFEELDFTITDETTEIWCKKSTFYIEFYKCSKCIELIDELNAYELNILLIKAIYQQLKELGWLDE